MFVFIEPPHQSEYDQYKSTCDNCPRVLGQDVHIHCLEHDDHGEKTYCNDCFEDLHATLFDEGGWTYDRFDLHPVEADHLYLPEIEKQRCQVMGECETCGIEFSWHRAVNKDWPTEYRFYYESYPGEPDVCGHCLLKKLRRYTCSNDWCQKLSKDCVYHRSLHRSFCPRCDYNLYDHEHKIDCDSTLVDIRKFIDTQGLNVKKFVGGTAGRSKVNIVNDIFDALYERKLTEVKHGGPRQPPYQPGLFEENSITFRCVDCGITCMGDAGEATRSCESCNLLLETKIEYESILKLLLKHVVKIRYTKRSGEVRDITCQCRHAFNNQKRLDTGVGLNKILVFDLERKEVRTLRLEGFGAMDVQPPVPKNMKKVVRLFPKRGTVPRQHTVDMQIFIKGLWGSTTTLDVKDTDTILSVKKKYYKKTKKKISVSEMRFMYGGKQLADLETLKHYGIGKSSTLDVALRILGGGRKLQQRVTVFSNRNSIRPTPSPTCLSFIDKEATPRDIRRFKEKELKRLKKKAKKAKTKTIPRRGRKVKVVKHRSPKTSRGLEPRQHSLPEDSKTSRGLEPRQHSLPEEDNVPSKVPEAVNLCRNTDCKKEEDDEYDTKCQVCDGYFADDGLNDIIFLCEGPNLTLKRYACHLCGNQGNKHAIVRMKGTGEYTCEVACDEYLE